MVFDEGDGPWWHDSASDEHYWNGKYCLEVMWEGDISLRRATDIGFVKHHPKRCNVDPYSCRYRGFSDLRGGAEFVASIVARDIGKALPGLVRANKSVLEPGLALEAASSTILRYCEKAYKPGTGVADKNNAAATPLARAALSALARKDKDELQRICALFTSNDDLEASVAAVIAETMGLSDAASLFGD